MGTEKYDTCILCGKVTSVLANTPLEQRWGYIEMVGQLCAECYGKMLEEHLNQEWQKGWEKPRTQHKKHKIRIKY